MFKPGKYIGSTYVQVGVSVGTYLIGRLGKPGGSRTNKWSHIGFDLLRAQILDSALTQGIKVAVQGVESGEMTCTDPSGAAWRITALIDGLAVQTTVHEGVLAKRTITTWVRALAAAELGVKPGDLRV